jgi:hypothetical protein
MTRRWWVGCALAILVVAPPVRAQTEIRARAATITVAGRLDLQGVHSSPDSADPSSIFFRRARIQADVALGDFIDARIEPDFSDGVELKDAWMRFNVDPAFRLSIGQFKRAHESFELTSSTELGTIEREGEVSGVDDCAGVGEVCTYGQLVVALDYGGRDLGLRAEGAIGDRVSYMLTLTNGPGEYEPEENDAKSFSGRVGVTVSDGVEVGGFWGVHDHPGLDDPEDTDYGGAGGVDVVVGDFREGLRVQAAALQGDNWRVGSATTFRATQAMASWFHPFEGRRFTGLEPLLRVSWADPDAEAADDDALLLTPGLVLHVQGRTRIAANVDVYDPAEGDRVWSLKLQTFLYF